MGSPQSQYCQVCLFALTVPEEHYVSTCQHAPGVESIQWCHHRNHGVLTLMHHHCHLCHMHNEVFSLQSCYHHRCPAGWSKALAPLQDDSCMLHNSFWCTNCHQHSPVHRKPDGKHLIEHRHHKQCQIAGIHMDGERIVECPRLISQKLEHIDEVNASWEHDIV